MSFTALHDDPDMRPSAPPEAEPELSVLTDEQLDQVTGGGGSWSGYWTWETAKNPPAWVWTWVWNQDSSSGWTAG